MVPQQTGGLSSALPPHWSTRPSAGREEGEEGEEGVGAGLKDGRRESPTFSSVSSAEAQHQRVSPPRQRSGQKRAGTGNQFGAKRVRDCRGLERNKSGPKIRGENKQKLNRSLD